ncbi:hypothetical protein [Methanogenium cariaci]|uniref:hypothetical protein n=1 Tax=Methanogenium cariaci TaxID=2197 RepID=UPI001C44776A|nr:hypothetical protein [Methanogenium cariaci]
MTSASADTKTASTSEMSGGASLFPPLHCTTIQTTSSSQNSQMNQGTPLTRPSP